MAVSIVGLEGVVEVMVALTKGEECEPEGVLAAVFSRVRMLASYMCCRIDEEGPVMHENGTDQAPPDKTSNSGPKPSNCVPNQARGHHAY